MTTTPDFRAELERLVDLYEALGGNWSPHGYTDLWNDALAGARAALAIPPPKPPTSYITFCAPPLAAALNELADQLWLEMPLGNTDADAGVFAAHRAICAKLLAIAAELEGHA
jgi:hypothetical protein